MLRLEDLADLAETHRESLNAIVKGFEVDGRHFGPGHKPGIMGVINLSPESWYRESVCLTTDSAVQRARVLVAQGADIIDIGAESTLAHASRADESLQNSKLIPVIRSLAGDKIRVSVETYDVGVAKACLEAGARVLNLTGTSRFEDMFRLVADHDAALILCFVEGPHVRDVNFRDLSGDTAQQLKDFFARQIEHAERAGVRRIWIDPGLGFYYRNLQDSATRIRHQMEVFLNTFRLRSLGYPTCHALPHAFECFGEEVRCAEPFFAVLAALGKTDLFRTHEVSRTRAVLETLSLW
jgi:dihydropteroate synthase